MLEIELQIDKKSKEKLLLKLKKIKNIAAKNIRQNRRCRSSNKKLIFFFLKKTKLYKKKRLKKDKSIETERTICWNLLSIIKLRLLSGKKPPDEISVKDRLKESKILTPEVDNKMNIKVVKIT